MNYPLILMGTIVLISVSYSFYLRRCQKKAKSKPLPRLPEITENLPLLIFYTDMNGHILYLNKLAEEMTGWQRDDAEGKPLDALFRFLPAPDRETGNPFEMIKKGGEALFIDDYTISINKKNRNYRVNISGAPVYDESRNMIGAVIVFRDIADELEYQKTLSSSEEKYRALFESSRDAIFIIDPEKGFIDCNQATLKVFGYPDKKSLLPVKPSDLSPLYQPDGSLSEDLANKRISEAMEKGTMLFEWIHRRKDERDFPAMVMLNKTNYGGKTLIQGTIRDISELKRAENELLKEKEFTETALNAQEDTFFLFEVATGKAIRWNKAFEECSGYSFDEIKKLKAPASYYSPEDLARASSFITDVLESGSGKIELELICKDGSKVPFEYNVSVIPDENNAPKYMISIGRDMTERNKSETKLQASEKRYRVLFERSADAILIIEGDRFTDCNEATVKMLRYRNKKELLETHPSELSPEYQPDGQLSFTKANEMIEIAFKRGSHRFEWDHKRADGEVFPVEVLLTSIPWLGEDILHVVWRDITERKKMEEMMVQNEKMLSVGGLAAGMAHEINNPLAGMLQTAGVMARRLGRDLDMPSNAEAAEKAGTNMETIKRFMEIRDIQSMLATIVESGRRVAAIVENMLSFARKGEGRKTYESIRDLVDKSLELAMTDYDLKKEYDFKEIDIKKEYEENLPEVKCEAAKIQQVILNILRNGAQAMIDSNTESPAFIIRLRSKSGRRIRIELEDNGPGMNDSVRKRIFEPFYTTKPIGEGTGLGLSVSFFIITENHQGTMTVESKPGAGTNFIIELPESSD